MMSARFIPEISNVPPAMVELLENYSHIARDDQIQHILKIRNAAWETKQYPCLGRFRFLELDLSMHPLYKQYVLPSLKNSIAKPMPLFLDIGTCLGQDVRKLAADGVSPSRLYGGDVVQEFIDAGYDLFCDEQKLPRDHFICPADVFDADPNSKLTKLDGQVTILHATAVFHLFDLEQQRLMADRCLRLLRKDSGKVLILGGQVAHVNAGAVERPNGSSRWRHDKKSWEAMWKQLCEQHPWKGTVIALEVHSAMATRRLVNAEMQNDRNQDDGFRWMTFEVWVSF